MKENQVVKRCISWIKDHGGYARKIHGNRYTAGIPDVLGCIDGQMIVIECKTPSGTATKLQEAELRKWREAGAESFVWHGERNLSDVLEVG